MERKTAPQAEPYGPTEQDEYTPGTKDCLCVKTFGGFSLAWRGKSLTGGLKSRESQFIYLMQLLLHHREEGVARDRLEEILFGDRDINNVHHAMQSVIYNAKKRLRKAGLPDVNYIYLKKGVFYWTGEIPVYEDAAAFDDLCRRLRNEEDAAKRLSLCLSACRLYAGEFLPNQGGMLWAAREARRYRGQFCSCVEEAARLLRAEGDYMQLEELGRYAAQVHPLADWETVTMEALTAQGRYEDAQKLYDDTVELYLREQGLKPPKRLLEMLRHLGEAMEHQYAVLDDIQEELSGHGKTGRDGPGGYLCPYPVFRGIYRMVERMMERGGQSVYLMLCTIVDSKGNPMRDGPVLTELSERLGEAISRSVRHSDAVSRYGKGQYLVLLVNTTRENCRIIQKRINCHFLVGRQRTGVQYYVNSVVCVPYGDAPRGWKGQATEGRRM